MSPTTKLLTFFSISTQLIPTSFANLYDPSNISKNPVQHNRTKHIDIRHHYIRDLVDDKVITLEHVATEESRVQRKKLTFERSKLELESEILETPSSRRPL